MLCNAPIFFFFKFINENLAAEKYIYGHIVQKHLFSFTRIHHFNELFFFGFAMQCINETDSLDVVYITLRYFHVSHEYAGQTLWTNERKKNNTTTENKQKFDNMWKCINTEPDLPTKSRFNDINMYIVIFHSQFLCTQEINMNTDFRHLTRSNAKQFTLNTRSNRWNKFGEKEIPR